MTKHREQQSRRSSMPRGDAHTAAWREAREQEALALPPELMALTREFLARMELAGNPGLKDRRRGGSSTPLFGWMLRNTQPRYGEEAYWVVTTKATWLFYDPVWDAPNDRYPGGPGASLREQKPSLGDAEDLLQRALVGYGAVNPAPESGSHPLARCDDPVQVAAILDRIGSRIFDEAILAVWPQLTRHPAFPARTHDLIEVHGRGSWFGAYRFRTSRRLAAWFADTDYEGLRMWVDEVGLAWTEAERRDRWIPTERRNAPTLAIVGPGMNFAMTRGYGAEPKDSVVMRTTSRRSASVGAARRVLATI